MFSFQPHLNELMTKKWLMGSNAVGTICVTVEDYFNDFARIKKPYKKVFAQYLGETSVMYLDTFTFLSNLLLIFGIQKTTIGCVYFLLISYHKKNRNSCIPHIFVQSNTYRFHPWKVRAAGFGLKEKFKTECVTKE